MQAQRLLISENHKCSAKSAWSSWHCGEMALKLRCCQCPHPHNTPASVLQHQLLYTVLNRKARLRHVVASCKLRQTAACQAQQQHSEDCIRGSEAAALEYSHCQKNQHVSRSSFSRSLLVAAALALQLGSSGPAFALTCPGLRGYALQQCLKEERKKREAEGGGEEAEQQRQRLKYDQPGELVTLPSGLQYREITAGVGPEAIAGSECDIMYTVYRLSSGGYYKYSSGGTPVYMWSVGYGNEGKDDVGETYRFRLGDPAAVPRAAAAAMLGMKAGGIRRVLIPPGGWASEQVGPPRPSFGSQRRWAAHKDEALLFEAQLVRVRQPSAEQDPELEDLTRLQGQQGVPFRLPAPPSPYRKQLLLEPQ